LSYFTLGGRLAFRQSQGFVQGIDSTEMFANGEGEEEKT